MPDIKKLFRLFHKTLALVHDWPRTTLSLFLILFAVTGWGLKFSTLELDIYDVYDPSFQSSVDISEIKSFYDDKSQMLVSFSFSQTPTASEACKLIKWSKDIARYKDVKAVTSLWSLRAPKIIDSKLWYPKIAHDPCGLNPSDEFQLQQIFSETFFRHLLARTGSNDLVFDVSFSGDDSDTSQVQYLIDETNSFLRAQLPNVKASYLGLASFRYYFKKIMLKDSVYNLLILLIIFGFMRYFYGTWRSGAYLAVTLTGSTVVLYGSLALLNIPIDILTNNLFLMTAVSGTADFIFVSQYQLNGEYKDSLKKLIVPCFFTTLTTVVGFLSLNTSDLSLINRFGNGAAIGAIVEWMMVFLFLPAFLKLIGHDKNWVNKDKAASSKLIDKIENVSLPPKALWIFGILMILSIPGFFFLNDQDSPVENLPKGHVLRDGYEDFRNKFNWQGQVYLYFPEKLSPDVQETILSQIAKLDLVYRLENPEELASDWTAGLPPLKQDLIRRELSMTPLWEKYYSAFQTLRVPLYLKEQDLHSLRKLREQINPICAKHCRLAGQRVVYLEYGEKISKTMIESFGVSILLVIGILGYLLWILGKIKHLLAVVMSSLMGPLVILTLIALFQVPVTLVTSIFLAIMVGLAGDNAVQYLLASDENLEEGIQSRGRASIMVTLVMIMGSSMFMLQSLYPMKILGVLFVTGFFINLIGDLWGLKGLLTNKGDG